MNSFVLGEFEGSTILKYYSNIHVYSYWLFTYSQLGEHKLVTAGADYTVLVWYFRKAVELMKQDEEAKKRLWTAPGYQRAFNKYRSEGSKLEMQQQQLEDHYIEIPIKTGTTTTSKNIFKKLTT